MAVISQQDGRKTIIHVITQLDRGGSARSTVLTVLGHDRRRFRVSLAYGKSRAMTGAANALTTAELEKLRQAGIALFEVPTLVREIRPLLDARATLTLWRLFRRERPALVHTHTSKAGAVGRIAAWLARVPAVVHTPHGHVFYGYFGRAMSEAIRLSEQVLARITDRIVALTDQGAQEHIRYQIAGPEKFVTIPSGIDLSLFRSVQVNRDVKREELGLPPEGLVVGTVGRLVPIKGHAWLLKAIPLVLIKFPRAFFVVIGDGPLLGQLRGLAEELGIGRSVAFLGAREDVPECLAALDLFVFPSLNEGLGRALIEAMAVGLPVVATRVGGIPDIVVDGKNGVLVPPQDAEAVAAALLDLLRDPCRLRHYGEAAKRSVDNRFDVASMVREIECLYDAVLQEKQVSR